MNSKEGLSAIVPALIALGRTNNLDAMESHEISASIHEAVEINRLHWPWWDAVTRSLSYDDLVSLFKAVVTVERVLNWSGGSVAAAIWIFREMQQRNEVPTDELADWALAHTENHYVPFGTTNLGAKSFNDLRQQREVWQARKSATSVLEKRRADEGARKHAASQQAHVVRMAAQCVATELRRTLLARLDELPAVERLCYIAADEAHAVSYYQPVYADVSAEVLLALEPTTRTKLIERTAESGLSGWKRLHRRLADCTGAI